MNEDINSKINFLKVTIKRKLEVIGEVLSSEKISNYNEREDIISEINFLKLIIERNLKKIGEALETEKISNYNNERNESNKIIVKYLSANS